MTSPSLVAHGLGTGPAVPEWPPLTRVEVAGVLEHYLPAGPVEVRWRSPRPWSAAALVRCGSREAFLKRHHQQVRTSADLAAEHAFAAHLRAGGIPVPAVLRTADGSTTVESGPWVYEAHDVARGTDRYREARSWTPYHSVGDAWSAGAALARLQEVAATYQAAARPGPPLLSTSTEVVLAADPTAALLNLLQRRPATTRYLQDRGGPEALLAILRPALDRLAPYLADVPVGWAHNDWHGSNLLWDGLQVSSVIDLGLANRTAPIVDLATALERATIGWLDLTGGGQVTPSSHPDQIGALIEGFESVRRLTDVERAILPVLLPVVHVELALSEVEYYLVVRPDEGSVELAYEGYLLGHLEYFASSAGKQVLAEVRSRLA